jgi:UrcA family protein
MTGKESNMIRCVSIATAAAMLAAGATHAAPAGSSDTYAVRIATGDLDLASPAGQATLQGRIGRAANLVCGPSPVVPLAQAIAVESCRVSLARSVASRLDLAQRSRDTRFAGTR